MSNKKLHLVLGLVLAMFLGVMGSFTSAVNFKLNFGNVGRPARVGYMLRNMAVIHFNDNGNDFGGFIYFSNVTSTGDVELESGDNYKVVLSGGDGAFECWQKAKGFYYNAERGERLWPLDDSYHMDGVSVNGGLYTRCRREGYSGALATCAGSGSESLREQCEKSVRDAYVDAHGYYGMIIHTYGSGPNAQKFILAAGTNYVPDGGAGQLVMGKEFSPTLIRFDNKYPVGFIYDANGGLGFLGGEITDDDTDVGDILSEFYDNGGDLDNLFYLSGDGIGTDLPIDTRKGGSATNSLISVVVDGLVGINRDTDNFGIQGNQSNEKMQYFASVNINNMQLMNYARQRAEILCRGKWEKYSGYGESLKSLYCFNGSDSSDPIQAITGTTIIVKNKDVRVTDMSDFNYGGYYDIFIDGGDLYIHPQTADNDLKIFKRNGFISDMTSIDEFWMAANSGWNSDFGYYTGEEVVAGKFIKGNFVVNGQVKTDLPDGLKDVYFIYGKMTTKDTVDELGEVFKWRCKLGMTGTNNTPCPGAEELADGTVPWTNPYENAALVIIDQNYPSPLYN